MHKTEIKECIKSRQGPGTTFSFWKHVVGLDGAFPPEADSALGDIAVDPSGKLRGGYTCQGWQVYDYTPGVNRRNELAAYAISIRLSDGRMLYLMDRADDNLSSRYWISKHRYGDITVRVLSIRSLISDAESSGIGDRL